ncbi:MAG: EscU/YscU/HrcU family type III secretion system export apparatus switch protein [bacterium]
MSPEEEPPDNLDFTRSDEVVYGDPSKETPAEERKAVALEYDEGDEEAPRVTAKGEGQVAEKIIELAEREDVPLYEDRDLVELLYGLDLDEQIPPSLYEVVAEVFAFLYRLNEEQNDE